MGLWSGNPKPNSGWLGVGATYSFDWCRFRRFSHCYFSGVVNESATREAGYLVYEPVDRGNCHMAKWDAQEHVCEVSMPGPHVPRGFLDATVPWEAGGQRQSGTTPHYIPPSPRSGGVPPQGPNPLSESGAEGEPLSVEAAATLRSQVAHLVALRTVGVVMPAEYDAICVRLGADRTRVSPTSVEGSPGELLIWLGDSGAITQEESERFRQRL